ncbi:hypothetical protein D3C85_1679360 [compost metagenome]
MGLGGEASVELQYKELMSIPTLSRFLLSSRNSPVLGKYQAIELFALESLHAFAA